MPPRGICHAPRGGGADDTCLGSAKVAFTRKGKRWTFGIFNRWGDRRDKPTASVWRSREQTKLADTLGYTIEWLQSTTSQNYCLARRH